MDSGLSIEPTATWVVTGSTADDEHVPLRNALQLLRPTRQDYATAPILESFNWDEVLHSTHPGSWYLVAFRSHLRAGADAASLHWHDHPALSEALDSAP